MKALVDFIKESQEDLELYNSINYNQFSELLLFIDRSNSLIDRRQAICDIFRKQYKTNLQKSFMMKSIVFQRFVDDVVNMYNNASNDENHINLNVATRKHLEDDLASKMIIKINTEQDLPVTNIENRDEIWK